MNCCRCGKNFDYEKHNGICPKCAAYNSPQGEKPYDYDVDKDFSSHYEAMDDSHAKLHRMYDSAPAHRPEKQHAEYHRQYDNHYRHPQPTQGQSGAADNRAGQLQGQGNVPGYRASQPQGQNGVLGYRASQPQGQNGVPGYRVNQPQSGMPNNSVYPPQGQSGMTQNRTYQMQGQNGKNASRQKSPKNMAAKVFLIIVIINVVASLIRVFYRFL